MLLHSTLSSLLPTTTHSRSLSSFYVVPSPLPPFLPPSHLSSLFLSLLPSVIPLFSLTYPLAIPSSLSLSPTPLPFPPLFSLTYPLAIPSSLLSHLSPCYSLLSSLSPSFPHPSLLTFPDVSPGGMVTVEKVVVAMFGNVHSPSSVLQHLLNLVQVT